MKTPSKEQVAVRIGWLLAELLVVFAGVYLAFWLSRQRAEARAERRQQQIYQTLHETLSGIGGDIQQSIPWVDSVWVEPFFPEYKQGKMPKLRPFYFSGNLNTNLWQAMLEAGGLDALEMDFIQDVEGYFQSMRYLERRIKQAQELNNELLLPNLGKGMGEFYDLETKQLKPKYRWYPDALQDIINIAHYINDESDSLLVMLEERMATE